MDSISFNSWLQESFQRLMKRADREEDSEVGFLNSSMMSHVGVSINGGPPVAGWFIWETPITMDDN